VGVDANPEAHEHARLRYTASTVRFARDLVETFAEPADAVVFLQTIEHVRNPDEVLEHFKTLIADSRSPLVVLSTPNVLTLAPEGAERSGNPWHVKEYRPAEFRALCEAHFGQVDLLGLFHARKLALHELALKRLRWDAVHARLGITRRFYDWFTPAISVRDFALRADRPLERALDFVAVCRP
jgi:2-polyprenyl-3-methyl-5-hydroxy-6-metoxy-1,4-benzoquinol methylase